MKRNFIYIENYKGIKIYQDDDKKYNATVYINSIYNENLNDLKIKIDEIIYKDVIKFIILD